MESVSNEVVLESLKALQSTIGKLENAVSQMAQSGASTTLAAKRLKAVSVSLAVLEHVWNQKPLQHTWKELEEARAVIAGLFPSLTSSCAKAKTGSPQKTLLKRRIKALALSIQAIEAYTLS